jgi:hypothetical protein
VTATGGTARLSRTALAAAAVLGLPGAVGCGEDAASVAVRTPLTGCADPIDHPVAPGGYYVNGNTICTETGRPHLFHGIDRPSLEWSPGGINLAPEDFDLIAAWHANVVRVPLYQDYWLSASPLYDAGYPSRVDSVVGWVERAGMDVILDLHWSDAGVLGGCATACQQRMPDVNSVTFWSEVAARYQSDGRVLFELYNEPHNVTWSIWKSGGPTSDGYQAVGMQQLYDTIRATGAENVVIVGGLDWAFDLSGVPDNRIDGHNVVYATHIYDSSQMQPGRWDSHWGFLTASDPVIVTEFGDTGSCSAEFASEVMRYADRHSASWTAWAWYPGGCAFPSLIDDWSGTPSAVGMSVRSALLAFEEAPTP